VEEVEQAKNIEDPNGCESAFALRSDQDKSDQSKKEGNEIAVCLIKREPALRDDRFDDTWNEGHQAEIS
jgi:hypothetical protein